MEHGAKRVDESKIKAGKYVWSMHHEKWFILTEKWICIEPETNNLYVRIVNYTRRITQNYTGRITFAKKHELHRQNEKLSHNENEFLIKNH